MIVSIPKFDVLMVFLALPWNIDKPLYLLISICRYLGFISTFISISNSIALWCFFSLLFYSSNVWIVLQFCCLVVSSVLPFLMFFCFINPHNSKTDRHIFQKSACRPLTQRARRKVNFAVNKPLFWHIWPLFTAKLTI